MVFVFAVLVMGITSALLSGLPADLGRLLVALVITGVVWLGGQALDRRKFIRFGMRLSPRWWQEFGLGTAFAVLASIVVFLVGLGTGWIVIAGFSWEYVSVQNAILSLLRGALFMLCVGYYEELLFRGYMNLNLFEGLYRRDSPQSSWVAGLTSIFIISAVFAIAHAINPNANIFGMINILLAGVMLGIPFLATGRLGMSVGIHFAWNFTQGPLLGMPVSGVVFKDSFLRSEYTGADFITGGRFGFEGGLAGLFGILLIMLLIGIYLRKTTNWKSVHPEIVSQSIMYQNLPEPVPALKQDAP